MAAEKIAITIEKETLKTIDHYVKTRVFSNRSKAIQEAVQEKIRRMEKSRLTRECAKLQRNEEKSFAEEGLALDAKQWPVY